MFATLVLSALMWQALPLPSASAASVVPSGTPTPQPDASALARARSFFRMLQTGKFDRSQLTSVLTNQITDDKFANIASQLAPLGEPLTFEQERLTMEHGSSGYAYLVAFGDGTKLEFLLSIDNASGLVNAMWLRKAP